MPSRTGPKMDGSGGRGRVRLKAHYSGDLLITSLDSATTFDELCAEVREMCWLHPGHPLTLKWVDNEGDPCTVSSQMELEEAFRLSCQHKDEGLTLHVFPSIPKEPGMPCPGEDKSIYRRGARRWRKLYRANGHLFQAKRFNRRAYCGQCSERIWGLARQGYRCIHCKLLVHKRCYVLVPLTCSRHMDSVMPSQEPAVDDKSDDVDLPSEESDGIAYISSTRKHDNIKDDAEVSRKWLVGVCLCYRGPSAHFWGHCGNLKVNYECPGRRGLVGIRDCIHQGVRVTGLQSLKRHLAQRQLPDRRWD